MWVIVHNVNESLYCCCDYGFEYSCLFVFRVLVGAPKANYTTQGTGVVNPGKLYKCVFGIGGPSCTPLDYYIEDRLGSGEQSKWLAFYLTRTWICHGSKHTGLIFRR